MWVDVQLQDTPEEFQQRVNKMIKDYELLQVKEQRDDKGEIYKYSAYLLNGNLCRIISMWYGEVLHGHFTDDSMIIGEIKQFIEHPKTSWWFK
jgi:tryptophanyl-tRNA synthetase